MARSKLDSQAIGKSPRANRLRRSINEFLKLAPIGISAIALYVSCVQRDELVRSERQQLSLRALRLGRIVSVHESISESYDLLDDELLSKGVSKVQAEAELDSADAMETSELRIAARDLEVALPPRLDAKTLKFKLYGQLGDRYGSRIAASFSLGVLLGHCDSRALHAVTVSETSETFGASRRVADAGAFGAWAKEVDSLLKLADCPVRLRWSDAGSLWWRFAQGNAVLEASTEWLATPGSMKPRRARSPRVREDYTCLLFLKREKGAPRGYTSVVGPWPLSRSNSQSIIAEFRHVAWLEAIPDSLRANPSARSKGNGNPRGAPRER